MHACCQYTTLPATYMHPCLHEGQGTLRKCRLREAIHAKPTCHAGLLLHAWDCYHCICNLHMHGGDARGAAACLVVT